MIPSREEMAAILASRVHDTGCWKDFNTMYKAWRKMKAYSEAGGENLMKPGEAPNKPSVEGFENLSPSCEGS